MKLLLLIMIFSAPLNIAIAQPNDFTIEGRVMNVDTGKVFFVPVVSDETYYGEHLFKDSPFIKDGLFKITRKAFDSNTYAYRLVIQSPHQNGATDFVFINGKNVFIEIDTIDEHISPKIATSLVQNEMQNEYNAYFKNFVERFEKFYEYADSMYTQFNNNLPKANMVALETTQMQLLQQSDSLFAAYAANHPTSQVTLWKMIERLENLGYHSMYENIFRKFPDALQSSFIGQRLMADITDREVLKTGNVFPAMRLENTKGEVVSMDKNIFGKKYTLVDFWFTDCSPCRKQFPAFKRLFNTYSSDGFQIIAISIDGPSKLNSWKTLIQKDALNWRQLLDKAGVASQKIGINAFPTNFLLDSNGVILQKNITISELEALLMKDDLKM